MPRYAGVRDDGRYPFVVTTRWYDQVTASLVWAFSITDAKAEHGFTRELHTTKRVRRATVVEVEELDRG